MLQRQLSIRDEFETEAGLEALEEPLKAKKRKESENQQGRTTFDDAKNKKKSKLVLIS